MSVYCAKCGEKIIGAPYMILTQYYCEKCYCEDSIERIKDELKFEKDRLKNAQKNIDTLEGAINYFKKILDRAKKEGE